MLNCIVVPSVLSSIPLEELEFEIILTERRSVNKRTIIKPQP
jgi:hypothetical protein